MGDTRRIALVGTAGSQVSAPYTDPDWEIWGVGMRAACVTRATRWFELHRLDGEQADWAAEWREAVRSWSHDCEVMMLYPEDDLGPRVTRYPHERIANRFGTYFMTSSFSWMMALAIDEIVGRGTVAEGDKEIGLWGVDMEYGTEYREQRVGLRHFIDLARCLGIHVRRLAAGGMAYEPVPYPLIQDDPLLNKLAQRQNGTQDSLRNLRDSLNTTQGMIASTKGALDEVRMMSGDNYDPTDRSEMLGRQLENLTKTSARISHDIVRWEGIEEEQNWLSDYLQP